MKKWKPIVEQVVVASAIMYFNDVWFDFPSHDIVKKLAGYGWWGSEDWQYCGKETLDVLINWWTKICHDFVLDTTENWKAIPISWVSSRI